jgi:hypothetical protein
MHSKNSQKWICSHYAVPYLSKFPIHRPERSLQLKLSLCVNDIMLYVRSWGMAPLILNLGSNGYEWLPQQSIQTLRLKQSPHPTTSSLVDSSVGLENQEKIRSSCPSRASNKTSPVVQPVSWPRLPTVYIILIICWPQHREDAGLSLYKCYCLYGGVNDKYWVHKVQSCVQEV